MRTVFVSSYNVDRPPASDLIAALKTKGVAVESSPGNPADRIDPKWQNWYEAGLMDALARSDTFVTVVTDVWESIWMASECQAALDLFSASRLTGFHYWNPQGVSMTAAGLLPYLKSELPVDIDQAVEVLVRRSTT